MFKAKRMAKVRLIVLKSKVELLIKDLHEAGLVDIRKTDYAGLEEGRPLPSFDMVSTELLRLRSAIAIMEPLVGKSESESDVIPAAKAMQETKAFEAPETLRSMNNESNAAMEKLKSLENEAALAQKLSCFKNVDFRGLSTRTVSFKAGEIQAAKIPKLTDSLDKTGATLITESGIALVLFSRKEQQAVDAALAESGFNELSISGFPDDSV